MPDPLSQINREIIVCRRCPRLVKWREKVAREKVSRFSSCEYWGKPVPGFGDPDARILIIGLAPAAHGANRTGRMFTGDRSGEWLYGTLHKFGLANLPDSVSAGDKMKLKDCYITAVARCAPPQNKPSVSEIRNCQEYLQRELSALRKVRVLIALGKIAFDRTLKVIEKAGVELTGQKPKFSHNAVARLSENLTLIASYHPSQQNTFTGKLTRRMFEDVFDTAIRIAGSDK